MADDRPTDETSALEWSRDDEVKRTWAGDLTLDVMAGEAILSVEQTVVTTFRLRIPYSRLEALIRDFDWARVRLKPPSEWYADSRVPSQREGS
jgi:hypothetical protein